MISKSLLKLSLCALAVSAPAFSQGQAFTPGNLVVAVEGCGVYGGSCTAVQNGTGSGGSYGDNQASPLTLFQYTPNGTASVAYVNSLVLPQAPSGANVQVSGEYGSSSEATIQLSGAGQYLTIMGYGIDALSFNANPENYGTLINPKGAPNYGALGQTGSLTLNNQTPSSSYPNGYTPVPRVLALIDANGNVNTASAFYNIFDFNNPRSAYTEDGSTAYLSGQGSGTDTTGGVFYSALGAVNDSPTVITGDDTCASSGCTTPTIAQDTRTVQIYSNTLYISVDSTEGKSYNRSFIGTLGNPPATSLYNNGAGPTQLTGFGTSNAGKLTITTGAHTNGNPLNNSTADTGSSQTAANKINLSPMNYFFASPTVLYVADSGDPKNDSNGDTNDAPSGASNSTNLGDGGLQKWVNESGTWTLVYTMYAGLNLVNNGNGTGTSGLYGLAGQVVGSGPTATVYLYATNYTLSDLDPTYLYGITDTLSNTTAPSTSAPLTFTLLDTAPTDSNFKGVSFAPSIPNGDVEITSVPSGLAFTSSGTGCAAGSYTTPITLPWSPGSNCTLTAASPQSAQGVQYVFSQWSDGTTTASDTVTAPQTTATYTANFLSVPATSVTSTGLVYNRIKKQGTETITVTNTGSSTISGPMNLVLSLSGATAVNNTGTFQGNPYWTVTAGSLAPGASAQVSVTLAYALGTNPTSTSTVYSGNIQ